MFDLLIFFDVFEVIEDYCVDVVFVEVEGDVEDFVWEFE